MQRVLYYESSCCTDQATGEFIIVVKRNIKTKSVVSRTTHQSQGHSIQSWIRSWVCNVIDPLDMCSVDIPLQVNTPFPCTGPHSLIRGTDPELMMTCDETFLLGSGCALQGNSLSSQSLLHSPPTMCYKMTFRRDCIQDSAQHTLLGISWYSYLGSSLTSTVLGSPHTSF